eukprot:CAMPEP_0172474370 /NCGR_PEP_ID=MMETSP1065-20121228/69323_1 /TAXON_ID=265537 /ORGANISM="Amphiprora paludosa, Strain CCMP125" /LENGTH=309 /DNA_ID=CAMNT_0013232551 /DNA_START=356 /DNA_END=1285 /DNA_ORIENTATION=+
MKFSTAVIFAVAHAAAAASAEMVPADIALSCQGLDLSTLTTAEKTFAASSLGRGFNHISGSAHQIQEIAESNGHFAAMLSGAAVKDDNCWLCLDDDDSFVVKGGSSRQTEVMQLWEHHVEASFKESPYSAFSGAHDCSIDMQVSGTATNKMELKTQETDKKAVTSIGVQCEGLEWNKLSSTEKSYFAFTLGHGFNHVVNGNKNRLSGMSFTSATPADSSVFGLLSGFSFSGNEVAHFAGELESGLKDDNCWLCLDDDDSLETSNSNNNMNEATFYQKWVQELEEHLADAPYSALHANHCRIEMFAKKSA